LEEYLTVNELSNRIKFSRQSLYNLIHRGVFILGIHYLKPTPKKVLFKWSEIQIWLGESLCSTDATSESHSKKGKKRNTSGSIKAILGSLINI